MKKLLIATNIMLLVIISFMACNSNEQDKGADINVISTDTCLDRFCITEPFAELRGVLDPVIIKRLSESYAGDNGKGFVNSDMNSKDALSVVFDIEKIKTLISTMQKKACECNSSFELGIRYYFIKYPPDLDPNTPRADGLNGLPSDNSNKHSLVMVPVYRTQPGGDWYDYDLWMSNQKICFPKIDTTRLHISPGGGLLPNAGDNHGGIGPPPEPGTFPTNEQE